jgi:hypothetical protein
MSRLFGERWLTHGGNGRVGGVVRIGGNVGAAIVGDGDGRLLELAASALPLDRRGQSLDDLELSGEAVRSGGVTIVVSVRRSGSAISCCLC